MNIEQLRDYCMSKAGVTEEFPFDEVTLVFKVMGKLFCMTGLEHWEQERPAINLKCDPDMAVQLRIDYDGTVVGGYHSNKKHWNTIYLNEGMIDDEVFKWIDHSYDLVVRKLTKKDKETLKNMMH